MPLGTVFHPASLGPFGWGGSHPGSWRPTNPPKQHGRVARRNPTWSKSPMLAARILVGLSVGGAPTWSPRFVVDVVKRHWDGDASFLTQIGLWRGKDGARTEEESVAVVITDTIGLSERKFMDAMGKLGDALATELRQELVIIEIQRGGQQIATGYSKPKAARRSRKRKP